VKQIVTILFSLLLIAAQTFAVALPVGSSAPVTKRSCCGDECQCCVSQPEACGTAPIQAPSPVTGQYQLALPLASTLLFTAGSPANETFPASAVSEFRPAATPLFRRNCTFLI